MTVSERGASTTSGVRLKQSMSVPDSAGAILPSLLLNISCNLFAGLGWVRAWGL